MLVREFRRARGAALPARHARRRAGRRQVAPGLGVRRRAWAPARVWSAGRASPTGRGSRTGPSAQIVRELAGIKDEHSPAEARRLIEAPSRASTTAERWDEIAQLLGLTGGSDDRRGDRGGDPRLPRRAAAQRPLIVLVDDIQWAEPTLLDLLARPARGDRGCPDPAALPRPAGAPRAARRLAGGLRLEPFGGRASTQLLAGLLGAAGPPCAPGSRPRPAATRSSSRSSSPCSSTTACSASRTASARSSGELDALALPASLHALLGARLDRLEPEARGALERGAVEGEVFHRGAVVELTPAGVARPASARASRHCREGSRPPGGSELRRRGCLPLQAHPRPGRRVPRHGEAAPRHAARAVRRLAGAPRRRTARASTRRSSATTSSRASATASSCDPMDDEISAVGVRAAGHLADSRAQGGDRRGHRAPRLGCSGGP